MVRYNVQCNDVAFFVKTTSSCTVIITKTSMQNHLQSSRLLTMRAIRQIRLRTEKRPNTLLSERRRQNLPSFSNTSAPGGDDSEVCRNFSTSSSPHPTSTAPQPATKSTVSTANKSDKTSVSEEEVSKFSSMASTWWKVDHNPLISMNPIRMSFITEQIGIQHSINIQHDKTSFEPFKGLKALDVGCGGGLLSESLARLGASVTAVDPSAEVAKAAQIHSQRHVKTRDIDYKGGMSVEELASQEMYQSSFDIVCVLEVIEHATDPKSLMQSAVSLLKKPSPDGLVPGGMLFVSTVNRTAKSFGIAIVGGEYVTGKLPVGTHDWNKFLSPREVHELVQDFGLGEVDKRGMILRPPFYDLKWYLDAQDFDVNWIGSYRHHQG